jgi:hypothetical protein
MDQQLWGRQGIHSCAITHAGRSSPFDDSRNTHQVLRFTFSYLVRSRMYRTLRMVGEKVAETSPFARLFHFCYN